uniref:Uncharacterized protein n=1 Tax=Anopheles darlingi TaxID=43151 RepID=A0A2M4D854_ANODA
MVCSVTGSACFLLTSRANSCTKFFKNVQQTRNSLRLPSNKSKDFTFSDVGMDGSRLISSVSANCRASGFAVVSFPFALLVSSFFIRFVSFFMASSMVQK